MRKTVYRVQILSLLLIPVLLLSGCGLSHLGRLYADPSESAGEKTLSERIAEWENFTLPGFRSEEEPEGANTVDAVAGAESTALPNTGSPEGAASEEAERAQRTYDALRGRLLGEWAELSEALPLFRPIVSWYGSLVLAEDGTYRSGSGAGVWDLQADDSALTLHGSRGKTVVQVVEDGDYTRLHVEELHLDFLRADELDSYIEERFVTAEIDLENVREWIAPPVNVGHILDEKDKRTGEDAWVMGSAAYDRGLVYYGRSEDFRLVLQNNSTGTRDALLPYDTLPLATGATFGRVMEAEGTLVFVRAEYVRENRMTDARTRTITFTDGTSHTTSMTWYSDLADYEAWKW